MFRKYGTSKYKEYLKKIGFNYLGMGKPDYPYMLDPIQLSFLISQMDQLYNLYKRPLHIYEIGVARGMTTAFLSQHILAEKLPHKITCIDTFNGFTNSDLNYEMKNRGKNPSELLGFSYNNYDVWKRNFSKINFVEAIQCDIANYSIPDGQIIDIVLADVDLYLPTKIILEKFYPVLSSAGVILIDDVKQDSCWDGAHQAYSEFCQSSKIGFELLGRKSGIIRAN